jgi:DNA mismatch repair protein MutS2
MSEPTQAALEFPGLVRVVEQYAVSQLGREFLAQASPLADFSAIQEKFQEIRELHDLADREGDLPLADFPNLSRWLAKAAVPGSLLPAQAMNDILWVLGAATEVRRYLSLNPAAAALARLVARLHPLDSLKDAIRQAVSPHNFILDQASPALAQVRRELAQGRDNLSRQIKQNYFTPRFQDAIQNPIITQRHGRYVIPVKSDHRGVIAGIIHDTSQTKATIYVEPLALVESNNALNLLANQEKREEEAVLRHLTDLVRHQADLLRENLASLAAVDAIAAKMRFAREFGAREPILRSYGGVDFRQARHPLLVHRAKANSEAPPVVPVDLSLDDEHRFLIISGANAGGKTVALKTLGLLTLMVQSGIPVPVAEGSSFAPFDHIFADIGDPQDLEQGVSTFSAHLKRYLAMLTELSERTLILLDELGTATDPTEGGALALALLKAFHGRGAWGAATTHLPLLKDFARREPGFENVAVVFDPETRRPTYRLAYGVAGTSNALTIARELGLSPEILEAAEGYLDAAELRAFRLVAEVDAAQEDLARRETDLAEQRAALQREQEALARERREFLEAQERLAGEFKGQALAKIKAAEAEFKAILRRLETGRESWGRVRQEFSKLQAELLEQLTPVRPAAPEAAPLPEPGQKVFLPALNLTGQVLTKPGRDGRLTVQVRQVKLKVAPEEVAAVSAAGEKRRTVGGITFVKAPSQPPSLNLVGLRVEEALPLVDRLIDQATLQGAERVDIIHGMGTGRLKQAVREHLRHHALVKAVHGDANPGVTLVDLKD